MNGHNNQSQPLSESVIRPQINSTIETVKGMQEAANKISENLQEINAIYDSIANRRYNEDEKIDYEKIDEERISKEKANVDSAADRNFNGDRYAALEMAKTTFEDREKYIEEKREHLENKGITLNAQENASVSDHVSKGESLKENFENKINDYKEEVNKLGDLEDRLENQPNKDVVKLTLIEDFADLSGETFDIMGFD